MLTQEEDLPLIGYWKVGLLCHESEDDLLKHLLSNRRFYSEDITHIKGKFIGAEILRTFYLEREPLSLIVKVHLLVENLINEIFKYYKLNENNLSFNRKLIILRDKKLLDEQLFDDISVLNNLRNSYAHNYYFDIAEFNIERFSYANGFYDGLKCRRKETKAIITLQTIQFEIIVLLLEDILNAFPFLVKKKLHKTIKRKFYEESMGEKFGKLIDKTEEITKGTKYELKIDIKLVDTTNGQIVSYKDDSKK